MRRCIRVPLDSWLNHRELQGEIRFLNLPPSVVLIAILVLVCHDDSYGERK